MEIPLTRLRKGKTGIVKCLEGGCAFQEKIFCLGIRIGKMIKVVSYHPLGGPIVVEVDNMRFAVGRGMAGRIIVEAK